MTILYALVARGTTVLAEFTSTSGNFPTITRVLLGKIPEEDGKMSYVYDQFVFHYVVENKITFLCMADENAKRRVPFAFLDDIKVRERVVARRRARVPSRPRAVKHDSTNAPCSAPSGPVGGTATSGVRPTRLTRGRVL